ncbi:MAG: asparagine synthase (glutamine-hydrolyzing) [Bacteroidetes bacterium]|nr:asparagine synthase (glutamine-hydrolyzing) [Bacteroidota bacterium]
MCGIVGYISTQPFNGQAMMSSLHHRGPDHAGGYSDQHNATTVFLGHTRLSILDLSEQGNQPMSTPDGQITIVFNGEVYNYEALRARHLSGVSFHSRTDTEVVLRLYEKMGMAALQELNGDFAFSIYDKRQGKVFLVKDRVGVKPLYYCNEGPTLIFGSEVKSLLAAGVKPELNQDELLNYFVFKYVPGNNTLHRNIKRLPPASYLEYDLSTGTSRQQHYWRLEKQSMYTGLAYRDAEEALFELLRDSTTMRLVSDVPVGNFLSGGLDSSILAYFVKDRRDMTHYCARKAESDLKKEGTTSDFHYASMLAKEWNLNLREAPIGSEEANTGLIRKTLFYSDDLIADGSQIPSYLITKDAALHSKVILSGMGADEIFLGYAGHMLTLLSLNVMEKMPFGLSGAFYSMASKVDQGKGKFLAYRRYIHKIGKYGKYPPYKYGILNLVGDFENSCAVFAGDKDRLVHMLESYFPAGEDTFDALARFEQENVLVKNLHYMDRMAMANSVECRVPFLDHRLLEFAFSIPRHYKLSASGKSKRILKDTFKTRLPEYIINRRKAGFGMPLRSIFSSREKVNGLLDKAFFANFNGFSVAHIDTLTDNHISGKEDNSSILYALISFQEWYKLNFT